MSGMALKVGIVGLRGIGNRHAQSYVADDLAELVAVCDVVKERADKAAKEYGAKAYYALEEMLAAHPDLDVVDVSTGGLENGSWHYRPVLAALAAGKNVLVEKPLSHDIGEARAMVAAADEAGVYFGCNLNHYFTPPAEGATEYMREGRIGVPVYCLHKMGFPGGEETFKPTGSPRHAGFPYFHMKAFLTHPFSVMRHFCGDITHVQAFVDQPGHRRAGGDVLQSLNSIHVRFASGAVGYLLSQRGDTTFGLGGWWSVEVGGTRGTFCIENCIEKLTFWPSPGTEGAADPDKLGLGKSPEPTVTESGITDFGETFPRRIHAYLEDVTAGVPREKLRASGRDALAALEYTWAAMESYEQGGILVRPHPLPPLHGDPLTMDK
jgi:predicted dehydrogenase